MMLLKKTPRLLLTVAQRLSSDVIRAEVSKSTGPVSSCSKLPVSLTLSGPLRHLPGCSPFFSSSWIFSLGTSTPRWRAERERGQRPDPAVGTRGAAGARLAPVSPGMAPGSGGAGGGARPQPRRGRAERSALPRSPAAPRSLLGPGIKLQKNYTLAAPLFTYK